MIVKQILLCLACCWLCAASCDTFAQELHLTWSGRVDLETENDSGETAEVFRLWKAYLNSRPDSVYDNPHWSTDQKRKYPIFDVGGRFIYSYVTGRYRGWSPHVLSIESINGGYEIQTTYLSHDTLLAGQYVWATQTVIARKEYGSWKLFSPMEQNLNRLQKTRIGSIIFLSRLDIPVSLSEAERTSKLADSVQQYYSLQRLDSLQFIITRNRNQMYELLGLSFLLPAPKGFAISNNRQLFSSFGQPWYPHELAHVLFHEFDKTVHPIIREGIATLIGGGSMDIPTYEVTLEAARRDMSKEIELDTVLDHSYLNGTQNIYYATGAWLCKRVLDQAGVKGLQDLMSNAPNSAVLKTALPRLVEIEWLRIKAEWKRDFSR